MSDADDTPAPTRAVSRELIAALRERSELDDDTVPPNRMSLREPAPPLRERGQADDQAIIRPAIAPLAAENRAAPESERRPPEPEPLVVPSPGRWRWYWAVAVAALVVTVGAVLYCASP